MKTIIKLVNFLRPFFWEVCLSILLGVATIGAGIGMLGTSAFLIASAALHPSIAELQVAIVGVRFFGISRAAFRYLERLVSHSVNLRVLSHIREWFYKQVESSPPAVLHTHRSGDLLDRVMRDLETLDNFYVRVVSPIVVAIMVGIGVSLFIGTYDDSLGMILSMGLLVNGFILPSLSILLTRKTSKLMINTRADLSAQTVELLQGLEEIQSNGAQKRWMAGIKDKSLEAGRWQTKTTILNGLNSGTGLLIMNLTLLSLLWMTIPMATQGSINGVSMAVILLMSLASFESVGNLPQAAVLFNSSLESAKRLFEVKPMEFPANPFYLQPEGWKPSMVEMKDVSFEYEDNSFRLEDVSFTLERGKKLGVIGPSGAGKTSLINLLLRFWQPIKGNIYLDQLEINDLDPYQVRSCFTVISQDTWLFSSSLRENLLLADSSANDQRLMNALHEADFNNVERYLPEGLDTFLGDQGMRLSGGERQRVAIARALLQNRPFIILDEPVENIDAASKKHVLETIFDLFNLRGLLLITHDLTLLGKMDEILVLENGSISERGDYSSLILKNGRFADMVKLSKQSFII